MALKKKQYLCYIHEDAKSIDITNSTNDIQFLFLGEVYDLQHGLWIAPHSRLHLCLCNLNYWGFRKGPLKFLRITMASKEDKLEKVSQTLCLTESYVIRNRLLVPTLTSLCQAQITPSLASQLPSQLEKRLNIIPVRVNLHFKCLLDFHSRNVKFQQGDWCMKTCRCEPAVPEIHLCRQRSSNILALN